MHSASPQLNKNTTTAAAQMLQLRVMMPLYSWLLLRDILLYVNMLRVFSFPGCGTRSGQLVRQA